MQLLNSGFNFVRSGHDVDSNGTPYAFIELSAPWYVKLALGILIGG